MRRYNFLWLCLLTSTLGLGACATYNHAEQVKLVAFSDDLAKGKSVGNIRGEDCVWSILGYKMGGEPTLDRAFISAREQTSGLQTSGAIGQAMASKAKPDDALRYVNNVHTQMEGFDALVVGKKCLVVSGLGYK